MVITLTKKEFKKRFKIIFEVGSGSYGCIYKAYDKKRNQIIALKKIQNSNPEIKKEINTMKELQSDNIVSFIDAFICEENTYIQMEFCGLGNLGNFKQQMTESFLCSIIHDISNGLKVIHNSGKIHFDIKPQNILLSSIGEAKIGDFGITRNLETITNQNANQGTLLYLAPECFEKGPINQSIDIWALGMTIFEMATGVPLKLTHYDSFQKWLQYNKPIIQGSNETWSTDFTNLLLSMLNPNPSMRPSVEEILNVSIIRDSTPTWQISLLKIPQHPEIFWEDILETN